MHHIEHATFSLQVLRQFEVQPDKDSCLLLDVMAQKHHNPSNRFTHPLNSLSPPYCYCRELQLNTNINKLKQTHN